LAKVVREAAENGLSGVEWASGVPGTFGGAVRGNAGAYGGETKDVLVEIAALDVNSLEIKKMGVEECEYGYRKSIFKQSPHLIILSATIKLTKGNKQEIQERGQEIIAGRIAKQPKGGSAGSFFVNPAVNNDKLIQEFEEEKGVKSKERKVPAGWLIERAGLKGKQIGGAMVSDIHPNYIMNTGTATAEDVVMLVSFVKERIRTEFDVQLKEEVQYLGL
jgi:UDP-N-acetylmuramate dehydrogenase